MIDGAMILMFVFTSGIGWSKLDELEKQMGSLQTVVHSSSTSGERLARVEEKIDQLIRQVDRLQTQADNRPRN
jgi:hypothetical protein